MRPTPVFLAAIVVSLAAAPAVQARPLLVLDGGRVIVRDDEYLPPVEPRPAVGTPHTPGRAWPNAAHAAVAKRTFRSELRRILDAGAIDQATYDADLTTWTAGQKALVRLRGSGRRSHELHAVLAGVDSLAASGGLAAGRLPAVTEIVRRNTQWWTSGSLLAYGQRVSFAGSSIVWASYPGSGIQPQWLGTFGKANALWASRTHDPQLRALLDEATALAGPRAGGIAWESYFSFSGARPVWVSALTQGTAIQALSRAGVRLQEPTYFEAARAATGIFSVAPPTGVRVALPRGAFYVIYSTNPKLRVINGFIQALVGLFDFAKFANDDAGRALFADGDAGAQAVLPSYDTGAWSLYDPSKESDLGYHELLRGFVKNLCARTATPVYCTTAQSLLDETRQPPVIALRSTAGRTGRPLDVRFTLSKISRVSLSVNGTPVTAASVGRGHRSLRWAGRAKPGPVTIRLDATDLAGNRASTSRTLTLRRP